MAETYTLSQSGVEWIDAAPNLARKWRAWHRKRSRSRSKLKRRLPLFPGEPKPSDFRMPAGRMYYLEAHWLWFAECFSARERLPVETATHPVSRGRSDR